MLRGSLAERGRLGGLMNKENQGNARPRAVTAMTAVLLIFVFITPQLSLASERNFNSSGCTYAGPPEPCPANSTHHIFFFGASMSSSAIYWTNKTRTDSYNNVPGWSTASTAYHGSSDLHMIYTNTLDSDTYGIYSCSTIGSGGVCDHGHVEYNAQLWPDLSGSQRQSLACHETGHSVGLAHPLSSGQQDDPDIFHCMVQAGWPMYLGDHNIWHMTSEPYYL